MNFNSFHNVCETDSFALKCTTLHKFKTSVSIGTIKLPPLLALDEHYASLFDQSPPIHSCIGVLLPSVRRGWCTHASLHICRCLFNIGR